MEGCAQRGAWRGVQRGLWLPLATIDLVDDYREIQVFEEF